MSEHEALSRLSTHEVRNQPPPLAEHNAFLADRPLTEAVAREAAAWVPSWLEALGERTGSGPVAELGRQANRHPPELRAFDRWGRRLDRVEYHPAYHELMALAMEHGIHAVAWRRPGGGHVAHAAAIYLLTQAEPGVCCPVTMTHAAVPSLRREPHVAAEWEPRLLAERYDPRSLPAEAKAGVTFGMAMTEKQGGSDVRANLTEAVPLAAPAEYRLTGHKWFCSAPMSDAFLTLAQAPEGLTCFLVPRWQPDGQRNPILIQRLKDKLGNRANASAEIEYHGCWARRIGEPGRGVATIIEMVQQTRLDAATAPVAMMRQALAHALHHARHRHAFGRPLIEQPLMRAVLADLALECEGAVALVMRLAGAFDRGGDDAAERSFARLATAAAKFWTNKRAPAHIAEAMECLGGGGYVEESVLPLLYREAPVNGIWEGSGNIMCLDVLRALERDPDSLEAVRAELHRAAGAHPALDAALRRLERSLAAPAPALARGLTAQLALCLQASLLLRQGPPAVADGFCETRLAGAAARVHGDLPPSVDVAAILARVWPE